MYQRQETTYFLVGKPYFINRLYLGSIGAEFWSSFLLIYYPGKLLLSKAGGSQFTFLVAYVAPVAFSLLLAVGIAHFCMLALPATHITIIQRKLYSVIGFSYWTYLGYVAISMGLYGIAIGLSPILILLFFSLIRRDY